jgi:transcription initiation factor TFIID subunit 6
MGECSATVVNISEQLGIIVANPAVIEQIAHEAEVFISHVLDEATSLRVIDQRSRLTIRDINESLRIKRMQPLYGYTSEKAPGESTVSFSRHLDLVVFRSAQFPIDTYTDMEQCRAQWKPSFNLCWLVVDGVARARESRPEAPKPCCEECVQSFTASTHPASANLRKYFEKTVELFWAGGADCDFALTKMASTAAIGSLLPQYLEFVMDTLKRRQDDCSVMRRLVMLCRVLVENKSFNAALHVDQLVAAALTILFIPCQSVDRNEIILKEHVCELIRRLCEEFGAANIGLTARIAEELLNGMRENTDKFAFYGALRCFLSLGADAATLILLPELGSVIKMVKGFVARESEMMEKFTARTDELKELKRQALLGEVTKVIDFPELYEICEGMELISDALAAVLGMCCREPVQRVWSGRPLFETYSIENHPKILAQLGLDCVQCEFHEEPFLFI